jgi:hypothetical protein
MKGEPNEILRMKMNRALKNMQRQRRQENRGVDVRVRSAFWEQVVREYRLQIERGKRISKETGIV